MLNQSGIKRKEFVNVRQILANVDLQSSVGCIVPQSIGVTVDAYKIAKAGTPININLKSAGTAVTAATTTCNAVLLHDVDVTAGAANGTALVFGFVNLNRVESDVATKLNAITDSGLVTLMRV